MPEEEPIVVLEKRIQRFVEVVGDLKKDEGQLREQLKHANQQISKKQSQASRWAQDRIRVQAKIQKLLTELDKFVQGGPGNG